VDRRDERPTLTLTRARRPIERRRPRRRIPKRAGSWYPREALRAQWFPDLDDAPTKEGHGHRYGEKWLNDNLQPLVRFVRSRVGRMGLGALRSDSSIRARSKRSGFANLRRRRVGETARDGALPRPSSSPIFEASTCRRSG
jgi:hypothetical protein